MSKENTILLVLAAVVAYLVYTYGVKPSKAMPAAGPGMTTVVGPAAYRQPTVQSTSPLGITSTKVPLGNLAS